MIKDYMTKDLVTVKEETTLVELLELLTTKRLSGLPVVDEQNTLLGFAPGAKILEEILPEYVKSLSLPAASLYGKDLKSFLEKRKPGLLQLKVKDIMVAPTYILSEESSFVEAVKIFVEKKINRIAVVDQAKKLTGILCRNNLLLAIKEAL